MKKIKQLLINIKKNLSSISSRALWHVIAGILIISQLVFGILSIHAILHYGVAIASFLVVSFITACVKHFNMKDTLYVSFGSAIAVLLIAFMII